jgi:hypothetical protein
MTTVLTLEALEPALREPFVPKEIKLLPKLPTNDGGKWTCIALPYADKRSYEDRLNELAYGLWSTPAGVPCVAGNKLIVPVTVVLCGVAHSDYGEAFLTGVSRKGEPRDEENSAAEAYSQGFRRACAQFRLGRYLYTLPKARVSYDPAKREIALSAEERLHLVERLYRAAGLAVAGSAPSSTAPQSATVPEQSHSPEPHPSDSAPLDTGVALQAPGASESQMQRIRMYCQALKKVPPRQEALSSQAAEELLERLTTVYTHRKAAGLMTEELPQEPVRATADDPLIQEMHLTWLKRHVPDLAAQQAICRRFGVSCLEHLRGSHFVLVTNEIYARQRAQQPV